MRLQAARALSTEGSHPKMNLMLLPWFLPLRASHSHLKAASSLSSECRNDKSLIFLRILAFSNRVGLPFPYA